MEALMFVDVEEWFHIPTGFDNFLPFNEWDTAQQRVQYVLPRILDLFEKNHDSSIFPGKRFYGFHEKFEKTPTIVDTRYSEIVEFPQSLIDFGFLKLSCFGGGYFRLFPKSIFLNMANMLNKTGALLFFIYIQGILIQINLKSTFHSSKK